MAKRRATDAELLLLYREGFSYSQIADYFGLSVSSVRGRISRFRHSGEDPVERALTPEGKRYVDPFYKPLYRYVREVFPDDAKITPAWVKRHVLNENWEPYLREGERRRKRYSSIEEAIDDAFASGISDCFYIYVIDAQSGEYGYFVDEDCSPK